MSNGSNAMLAVTTSRQNNTCQMWHKLNGRNAMLAVTASRQNNMCQMWHKLNDFKWNCKNCKKNHKV